MPKGSWDGTLLTCDRCKDDFKGNRGLLIHQKTCDGTKKSERGSRVRDRYRELFFANNGPGPYICVFCSEPVTFSEVIVHHVDHDRRNDSLENLAPAHRECHTKHHMGGYWTGKTHSVVHRERVAVSKRGLKLSDETRAKISKARKGQKLTPERAEALHATTRGVPKSEEHKRRISESSKRTWAKKKAAADITDTTDERTTNE